MIKRKSTSSSKAGDWDFFYFYTRSAPKVGTDIMWDKVKPQVLKSCVSCHSNAADMVFGRFEKPYVMPKAGDRGKALKLEVAPAGK